MDHRGAPQPLGAAKRVAVTVCADRGRMLRTQCASAGLLGFTVAAEAPFLGICVDQPRTCKMQLDMPIRGRLDATTVGATLSTGMRRTR